MVDCYILHISCIILGDGYNFVRWWNGNIPMSDSERRAWSYCFKESELQYPDSIDPLGKEQLRYQRECMKRKGY